MATYRIIADAPARYRVEAAGDGGILHVCGGLATQNDAEMWVEAHKLVLGSLGSPERRRLPAQDC